MIGFEQLPVEYGEFLEEVFELLVAAGHFPHFAEHGIADVFGSGLPVFLGGERISAAGALRGHGAHHEIQIGKDLTLKPLLLLLEVPFACRHIDID